MANCKQCNRVFEAKRSTARFCSDACKLAYHRSCNAKGCNAKNDTLRLPAYPATMKDAVGDEHPIDYEARRRNFILLLEWAEGKGNEYQQRIGFTSLMYIFVDIERYLGMSCPDLIERFVRTIKTQWSNYEYKVAG